MNFISSFLTSSMYVGCGGGEGAGGPGDGGGRDGGGRGEVGARCAIKNRPIFSVDLLV